MGAARVVGAAVAGLALVALMPRQEGEAPPAPRPDGSPGAGGAVPEAQQAGPLEALSTPVLVKRSVEIFPAGYLTMISIVQGVALSNLAARAVPYLTDPGKADRAESLAEAAAVLTAIVIVSYEYLWFTTLMRWAPTFWDSLVPFALGSAEVVAALLVGDHDSWLGAFAAFLALGGAAFANSLRQASPAMFAPRQDAYQSVRRVLGLLVLGSWALSVGAFVCWLRAGRHPAEAPGLAMACSLGAVAVGIAMVLVSERFVSAVHASYGVPRRRPRP